ncbi:DeoR family transcriptional regulator [Mangrovactinospora gilvigrisea]|uniref:DeoR family transcriptional regulator n=1 Tax=Mangrovactinospora gilvigrisea TaxID=1428644 RepID=A0A1J7BBZ2_9ACTN|nr:DeoR/GlpR family DNA-binding transcription regulator [Mangrovactinospora gilvigrisea]OIV36179.1 DeoR family transcriptional regulator [Mangrovactinospora gilvigrisea]
MSPSGTRGAQEERRQTIVDHVLAHGSASAADLAELTGVSLMTVHRDLDELERRGVVRKFRGGVSALPSTVFESNLEYRLGRHGPEKEALARAALPLVEPGMSVMLDDSTTVLALARLLTEVLPLTVVTNSRRVVDVFAGVDQARLICLGGEYSRTHDSYLGVPCTEAIEALSVDMVIVSTSAMDAGMTYHQEQDIVLVKRAMLASGQRKVLLMDHSKLPRTALHRLAPVQAYDHLVIDSSVPDEIAADLRERTEVRVART